jgi:predicted nuclease of restriction endonuclease-like (RecB) superfamily
LIDAAAPEEESFAEIVRLIDGSRSRALQAINTVLIELYWQIGESISRRLAASEWGEGTVRPARPIYCQTDTRCAWLFSSNLFRMKQFYEAYKDNQIVSPLVRQIALEPPPHHSGSKQTTEEREFYLRMAVQEHWTKRQLERQLKSARFEQRVLNPPKVSSAVRQTHPEALSVFRDSYALEFLGLPPGHFEADLHRGLLARMKDFLLELGRDFCFAGSEYPLQVSKRDFALDPLFYHRGLNALVAIDLKVGPFEPEYLGKLNLYLEALDRDVRKSHERPSIGVLLCASKDGEVVQYALSRTLSPALVAEYQTMLPDKELLQAKLHEFYRLNAPEEDEG